MGDKTLISWTDKTWNPWYGCRKVSAGCRSCYMFRDMQRYGKNPNIIQRSRTTFNSPLKWKEPAKVFTCSWSDFFIEEADKWRMEAWDIIRKTPHLTYQILTKRPERIADRLPDDWEDGYPNVWLGVTSENQEMADKRIPILMSINARVRFLSIEPLLGNVNLTNFFWDGASKSGSRYSNHEYPLGGIHWVIVGGESGPEYRPMNLEWARLIRDQCKEAGVAFFFKQESGLHPGTNPKLDGVEYHEFPERTR